MEQHEATKYVYCHCKCNYMLKDEAKHLEGPFHSLWVKMKTTPAPVSNTPPRPKINTNAPITYESGLTCTLTNEARRKKEPLVKPCLLDSTFEQWTLFASENNIHPIVSRAFGGLNDDDKIDMIEDKADYYKCKGNILRGIAMLHYFRVRKGFCSFTTWGMLTFEQQMEFFKQKSSCVIDKYNRKNGVLADISTLQLSNVDNEHSLSASFYKEHGHKVFPDTGIFLKENFPSIFEKKKFPF